MTRSDTENLPQVTIARMLIAAIPGVGGSATVLLEKNLQERREARTRQYLEELAVRIRQLENSNLPGDSTVQLGYEAARHSNEPWKPIFLANIVTARPSEIDKFLRHALIAAASDLNELEICTLTTFALDRPEITIVGQFLELRETIAKLEEESKDIESLKETALRKLELAGLASQTGEGYKISRLGEILLGALSS